VNRESVAIAVVAVLAGLGARALGAPFGLALLVAILVILALSTWRAMRRKP
jgi:CDP-diglyceride synthetase